MSQLTVKNWARFQHYKNRRPPWIKLYRDLLDDPTFMGLPLASMALAPCIWLLASENDGQITANLADLAWRFRQTEKITRAGVEGLIRAGLLNGCLQDASTTLAGRKQVAIPETEGERETETEGEKKDTTSDAQFDAWWSDYFRKEKRVEAKRAWDSLTEDHKAKAAVAVTPWCRWKKRTDERKFWPLPASWLNGHRFDDEIPLEPAELCTRCGREPRRKDSGMGDNCFKELGLGE